MAVGVLWSGDIVFKGTVPTLEMLKKKGIVLYTLDLIFGLGLEVRMVANWKTSIGKQVVFVTNNSTKSRLDYKKKLEKLGIPATQVSALHFEVIQLSKHG